jgi:hypothetical protein
MTATTEPTRIRAGDTWLWRREDLSDYPASSYTLKYRFKNEDGGFEIVAQPDGDLFSVSVPFSTTGGFAAGSYSWQAVVEGVLGRFTVDSGTLVVDASLFSGDASTGVDTRSHARRALAAINAVIEKRATHVHEEYEIRLSEGGSWRRVKDTDWADLIKAKAYYESLVASEQASEDAANGRPDKRRTFVRFRCGV